MARESRRTREAKRFGNSERLIDLAAGLSWGFPSWLAGADHAVLVAADQRNQEIVQRLAGVVVICADNITEFFFADSGKDEWNLTRDFPCVAPPYPRFFIETKRPERFTIAGRAQSTHYIPERWGWLFEAESRAELLAPLADPVAREQLIRDTTKAMDYLLPNVDLERVNAALLASDHKARIRALPAAEREYYRLSKLRKNTLENNPEAIMPADAGWIMTASLLVAGRGTIAAPAELKLMVSTEGLVLYSETTISYGDRLNDVESCEFEGTIRLLACPMLLALSFMHCKNVVTAVQQPDRDLNRARRKAGRKPLVRYHIIEIEPLKHVLRTEGNMETRGLKRAFHKVRGHMAHYTEERPLFGRLTGRFWIPMHTRGTLKKGIVVSDYNVHKPDDDDRPPDANGGSNGQ